jgi:nucleoside-diphosphate-sugar epimerase
MKRILVIGGDSRTGRAIARVAPKDVAVISRRGTCSTNTYIVPDYRLIPEEIFAGYHTVVNCVGTVSGSDDDLAAANVETPLKIAQTAAAVGVEVFVQISSFSVFGAAPLITGEQKMAPAGGYGKSKLRAEQALQQLSKADLKLAIIRFPMLYGYGRSKLNDLLRLWLKLRVLPAPSGDVARSMLHYDLAAQFVLWVSERGEAGLFTAADPEPFAYGRVVDALRQNAGIKLHTLGLPETALSVFRYLRPALHASLFEDSLLSNDANDLFQTGLESRLYNDIARIARIARKVQDD